jgi:hypothetical protein
MREYWLDLQRARLRVRRLNALTGRPDRRALISRAEASREADRAENHFGDARRDLEVLDICCTDPVKGLALIPFRRDDHLAWFVFDLFAPQGLDGWRFTTDPSDTRRMLPGQPHRGGFDGVFSSKPWLGTSERTNLK